MKRADYYHEIALHAVRIADMLEEDAKAAMSSGDSAAIDDVNGNIEPRATLRSEHGAFSDELGQLWTQATFDVEGARFMAEIIEVSDHRFRDSVSGRPTDVLKQAAAETIKADIRDGASEMLRGRVGKKDY